MLTVKLASKKTSGKTTKAKMVKSATKEEKPIPPVEVEEVKPEPKPRKSRAKPKLTKEEVLKALAADSIEMSKLINELKDDEQKLQSSGLQLKQVPELIQGELKNLEEEHKEIDEKINELMTLPETPSE